MTVHERFYDPSWGDHLSDCCAGRSDESAGSYSFIVSHVTMFRPRRKFQPPTTKL